ncbi:MAG TPA: DUF2207 domain-containing protein [Terriglobales bacterium]|nr:DUF2207 domain-containing protein [Terriglobales bacterium]
MRPFFRRVFLFTLLLGCSLPAFPQDQEADQPAGQPEQREVIRSYDSHIRIGDDGTLQVTEVIRVVANHDQINHGIYRDFPTDYRDRWGERYHVKFAVVGARRDGQAEDWHTEAKSNGVRVYLGSKDVIVPIGEHTYELSYTASREIGFFKDHDELYWNVTGNGWIFPIERATAEVTLPRSLPREQVTITGYTGPQGSRAQDFTGEVDAAGVSRFATTRQLGSEEGLTIVVMFPKGIVAEPTSEQKARWFFSDNAAAAVAFGGLVLMLLYQVFAWFAVGKDPAPGTVMVRYTPPDGFSPAAIRYLRRMGYDDKAFASLVVDMGVKRYLQIKQDAGGKFTLTHLPKGDPKSLFFEEQQLADNLFDGKDSIKLEQANHSTIKSAIDALKNTLAQKMEQHYFVTNGKYMWPSLGLTAATFLSVIAFSDAEMIPVALFMCVWLSGWTVGVAALSLSVAAAWKQAWHSKGWGKLSYGGALFITAFSVPFFAGEIFGLGMFARATSAVAAVVLIAMAVSNLVFHELLKAPTHAGRDLLDQVDGFREFIGATEDMERKYPLDRSPDTFEKFLPYAMAMDLEEVWTSKFESVLAAAAAAGGGASHGYSPVWMSVSGASGLAAIGAIGDFSGSLSSAISSSSTAPGSSSGGGGGGSSGGGGGGGGGGGW